MGVLNCGGSIGFYSGDVKVLLDGTKNHRGYYPIIKKLSRQLIDSVILLISEEKVE